MREIVNSRRGSYVAAWTLSLALFGLCKESDFARADVYAVVVGVNELPDLKMRDGTALRSLRGAEHDAERAAEVLREQYGVMEWRLTLLTGKAATFAAVTEALAAVARQTTPGDSVLFQFCGHGTQVPDVGTPLGPDTDEPDGLDEALCCVDARADGKGLLIDDELGRMLDAIPANDILVILDCCHAGTGIKQLGDDEGVRYFRWPDLTDDGEKRVLPTSGAADHPAGVWLEIGSKHKSLSRRIDAFFACRPEQSAYEYRLPGTVQRAGLFSHHFWSGLADAIQLADTDGNQIVTRCEAVEYAVRRLDEDFNKGRSSPQAQQTPMFQAGGADLPFLPGKPGSTSPRKVPETIKPRIAPSAPSEP